MVISLILIVIFILICLLILIIKDIYRISMHISEINKDLKIIYHDLDTKSGLERLTFDEVNTRLRKLETKC